MYNHSIEIAPVNLGLLSRNVVMNVNAGLLTPKQDCNGILHHEYAHHLSTQVVSEKLWVPKPVEALKVGGMPLFDLRNLVSDYAKSNNTIKNPIIAALGQCRS